MDLPHELVSLATVIVRRIGYGQRKIVNLSLLEAELNLPVEQYSYGIRERIAAEVALKQFAIRNS